MEPHGVRARMKSARGEPVAQTGPAGQNSYRLDPRVGLYRVVISVWASQSAVGALLLSGSLVSEFEVSLLCCRGPGESGELVGERDSGLVVAETLRGCERPGPDGVGLALLRRGGEHSTGAVDQQHAQVDVAALGDCAETPCAAGRSLARRQPEVAGEVPPAGKPAQVADEAGDRGRREQADAGDRAQALHQGILFAQRLEPPFGLGDSPLEFADLAHEFEGSKAQRLSERAVGVAGQLERARDESRRAGRDRDALLAQQSAQ